VKISLSARRAASPLLVLLLGLALVIIGESTIREIAAINRHNLFVTRHAYTQDMSCRGNDLDATSLAQERWIPADQFFTNASSTSYIAELFTLIEHQDGVNGYQNGNPSAGAYYAYSDHQFRDAGQYSSASDLSRNVPSSFLILYTDGSEVSTAVDLPAGTYQLQVYGNHDTPGPVTLLVDLNDSLLGALNFDRNDDSWEMKCLTIEPEFWPTSQTDRAKIAIHFIGDGGPNGIRDGMIAWLRIIPISSS
jgi:hypothetical protein